MNRFRNFPFHKFESVCLVGSTKKVQRGRDTVHRSGGGRWEVGDGVPLRPPLDSGSSLYRIEGLTFVRRVSMRGKINVVKDRHTVETVPTKSVINGSQITHGEGGDGYQGISFVHSDSPTRLLSPRRDVLSLRPRELVSRPPVHVSTRGPWVLDGHLLVRCKTRPYPQS